MEIDRVGWNATLEQEFAQWRGRGLVPARVAREDRGRYVIWSETGSLAAQVSGRFRNEAAGRNDFPAVGDWVAACLLPGEDRATIHGLLQRRSCFHRKVAGDTTEVQVIAANVDTVFLVAGLDQDFNLRRLERYLTLAWDSGADPVVLLNKTDLCDQVDVRFGQAAGVAMGVPVLAVSAATGRGVEALVTHLGPGRTGAFLGSSGVGKSTLINRLLGEERLETAPVREDDGKGRHTTTRRELFLLPGEAGLVLDTPGMRELQLWGSGESVSAGFTDLETLAARCRFRDCGHAGEPGCAVRRALASGTLDAGRFESYRKQQREIAYLERRRDQRLQREERARWKRISRRHRQATRGRNRGG